MESLVYEKDEATLQEVEKMSRHYAQSLKEIPSEKIAAKKDEVNRVGGAFKFLARFNILPANFGPKVEVENIIKEQHWGEK